MHLVIQVDHSWKAVAEGLARIDQAIEELILMNDDLIQSRIKQLGF